MYHADDSAHVWCQVEHVMEKLREHCAPAAMLEEMKEILDTDAEKFVLKMYRFVIYESEKQKLVA